MNSRTLKIVVALAAAFTFFGAAVPAPGGGMTVQRTVWCC
jgi:hypothetical protein